MSTLLLLGGNDRSLWANRGDLIALLLTEGWDVQAALPPQGAVHHTPLHDIPTHRVPIERTGMNPLADLKAVRRVRALITKVAPDAVLAYNPKPVIFGGLALKALPDVHFVALITGRGALERRPGLKGWLAYYGLAALYRRALGRPDVLLFQNDDDRALFDRHFGTERLPVVEVIPGSGVNLERFPRRPLPTEEPRFLMITKLLIDKGIREFVQAARELEKSVPRCRFRIVGGHDPSLPHALPAAELEDWKREGLIEFIGRVDDVRPHLAWCTVLCHPSYAEGTPRAVLEALSTGRPVITSDAPGCRQTVEECVSGFIVPPREHGPLASRMRILAREPQRVRRMAEAAWERARDVYDVHKVNARILEHLAEGVRVA